MFAGSPRYVIPAYQRVYSWKTENIKNFLKDLETAHQTSNFKHFFGFMITMDSNSLPQDSIKLIDGQQRITTVMLFLICARNFFYKHSKTSSHDLSHYVGKLEQLLFSSIDDHDRKKSIPTLTLSRPNREFFHTLVCNAQISDKQLESHASEIKTNKSLVEAYTKFNCWFSRKRRASADDFSKIYMYVSTLLSRFIIHNSSCDDKKEAQRIFNLVNNRGRQLDESDLIKNYLFIELEELDDIDTDQYDEIWNKILTNLTSLKTNFEPDLFFHHYLIVSQGYASVGIKPDKAKMYGTIENLIDNKLRNPIEIINGLLSWSKVLCKIRSPHDNDEFKDHPNITYYLSKLRSMNVKAIYPAILIGYERYWKLNNVSRFEILLMLCFKYHLRVRALGKIHPNTYSRVINDIIVGNILQGLQLDNIITAIMNHRSYTSTSETILKDILQDKIITNPEYATSLLEEIEWEHRPIKPLNSGSIEHIMPQKLDDSDWPSYIIQNHNIDSTNPKRADDEVENIHARYVNYLGNQTLLEQSINQSISNSMFDEKQDKYGISEYIITQNLKTLDVWDKNAITTRQEELAVSLIRTLDLQTLHDMLTSK